MKTETPLAKWFERSGYTQRQFAHELGVTEGHVSYLVAGSRQPSLELAIKIASLTGLAVTDLLLPKGEGVS